MNLFYLIINELQGWFVLGQPPSQAPFKCRESLAKTLKMDLNDVRVIKMTVGGGFGAKLEMLPMDFSACLLSKKAGGLPVKICYDREEEFIATRRKHGIIYKVKSGVKKDGTEASTPKGAVQ